MSEKTYEEVWDEFWAEICLNEDGSLNLDQVKRELAEWHFAMGQVAEVYLHVTDDALSKPLYYARDVIAVAEDVVQQRIEWAIADFLHDNDLPLSLLYVEASDEAM